MRQHAVIAERDPERAGTVGSDCDEREIGEPEERRYECGECADVNQGEPDARKISRDFMHAAPFATVLLG